MANSDAWSAGIDLRSPRKSADRNNADQDKSGGARQNTQPGGGGIPGLISRAIKNRRAKAGGGMASGAGDGGAGWLPSKKKGGLIKETGIYRLHKNEFVVPAKHVARLKKANRKTRKKVTVKA